MTMSRDANAQLTVQQMEFALDVLETTIDRALGAFHSG